MFIIIVFTSVLVSCWRRLFVRADVALCAVDYTSFFSSPLAFCVSLIRSLRNLIDASSATLRAPLLGTGGRT